MAHVITAFLLAASCLALSVQSSPFNKCSEGEPPLDLRVSGCDEFPCPLHRGTNLTAEWDFAIVSDSQNLKPRVRATMLGGVVVDYPLPEQDACKGLTNAECPLDEGEEVTYSLFMPISKFYPRISLKIEFALINEKGDLQTCFSVDAKVV